MDLAVEFPWSATCVYGGEVSDRAIEWLENNMDNNLYFIDFLHESPTSWHPSHVWFGLDLDPEKIL